MNYLSFRISYYLLDELLTLQGIILPGGWTDYPSGYHITWWRNCLPFQISYYLVDELLTLPDILLPGGWTANPSGAPKFIPDV
jgi:hypothetical protein